MRLNVFKWQVLLFEQVQELETMPQPIFERVQ
jgi:hypothetical protein